MTDAMDDRDGSQRKTLGGSIAAEEEEGDNGRNQAHNFREVLLCQICKSQFKDPRFLPCHHFFCRSCIEGLIAAAGANSCACPQCHKDINLPGNETKQLPVAFVVERIRERIRSKSKLTLTFKEHVCKDHAGIPLRMYCLECGQLICPECALHPHSYDYVTSVAPMYMESVKQQFETLTKIKDSSETKVGKIEALKRDVVELSTNVTDMVNQCFDEIARLVEDRRKNILEELTSVVQQQVEFYQKQESLLVSTIGHIEELMYKWNRVQATSTGDEGAIILLADLVPQLKQNAGKMAPVAVDSCKTINIVPDIDYVDEIKTLCERIKVHVLLESDPSTSPVQTMPTTAELGRRLSFSIPSFEKNDSTIVRAAVRTVADNTCMPLCVSGDRKISFTPVIRGRHELIVEVNGMHVTGSPFPLFVTIPLEQLRNPVRIISDLKAPYAVAFNSRGDMVMTHSTPHNWISVRDKLGRSMLEVKLKTPGNPVGVAVDEQDNIYVSDSKNHCIIKFSGDGAFLRTIGRYGSGHGEFSSPRGLKVIEGQLYVCDVGNGRVQIFNEQLVFVKSFKVSKDSTDIASSPNGYFYLSGKDIQVLDSDHSYLFSIYDMNSTSLCFNQMQNALCLADCRRNCLCLMNLATDQVVNGCLCTERAKGGQNRAYGGMAIDEDGYLYVCDTTNDRILVF